MRGLARAAGSARSTGSLGWVRTCSAATLALGLLGFGLAQVPSAGPASGTHHGEHAPGLVLSSHGANANASGIRSLLATSPWHRYLASEAVCPGAGRRDLPATAQADAVACLINFARRQRGLRPLAVVAVLNRASIEKANAIRRCETFAHNPCGGDWTSVIRSAGYQGAVGENLYLAAGRWGTPRAAILAWLDSPPHRHNLFRTSWREQGLALMTFERFGNFRDVSLWVSVLGDR